MDAKERARRFREHQELVSKVVKQQEDIKKKRRQKLTGEEAFERKQDNFFKPLLKTSQEKIIDASTVQPEYRCYFDVLYDQRLTMFTKSEVIASMSTFHETLI